MRSRRACPERSRGDPYPAARASAVSGSSPGTAGQWEPSRKFPGGTRPWNPPLQRARKDGATGWGSMSINGLITSVENFRSAADRGTAPDSSLTAWTLAGGRHRNRYGRVPCPACCRRKTSENPGSVPTSLTKGHLPDSPNEAARQRQKALAQWGLARKISSGSCRFFQISFVYIVNDKSCCSSQKLL
jgi:hypothetical protein